MSRTPNAEQLQAINSKNGVLLSAGAGSGKTFVIIEHLLCLIEEKCKTIDKVNWKSEIPKILNAITLMTFTKKAAGEMSVRLLKRLEEKSANDETGFWKLIVSYINSIQISTIHGFCHRLISKGYWPTYPSSFELLNDTTHKEKLRMIFNDWYEINHQKLDPVFLAHAEDIFIAIVEVFKNPDLRLMWSKSSEKIEKEKELDDFFSSIFELTDFGDVFQLDLENSFSAEQMKKGIYKLFHDFLSLKQSAGKINSRNMLQYFDLIESIARFPSSIKELSDNEIEFRVKLKNFVDFIRTSKNDLTYFGQNFETYQKWILVLKNVFDFFESKYFDYPGLAFADLEYYVCIGLDDKIVAENIANQFSYFIVDEFQDTSPIQFDILKKCTQSRMERLFCVGDKKQAIYGFRGGELQVFETCSELMGKDRNLNLLSNYRSDKKIIEFNNLFFQRVLPSGEGFEGIDRHVVTMEDQIAPNEVVEGEVIKYCLEVADPLQDPDLVEAYALLEIIKEKVQDNSVHSIAVLYKKLKPSVRLVELLQRNNIGFTAQTKINQDSDPVIQLFSYLIKLLLTNDIDKQNSLIYLIKKFIHVIGGKYKTEKIAIFQKNYQLYGVYVSFIKFLNDIKISDSYYENNLALIKNLTESTGEDLRILLESLERLDGSYSLELVSGKDKKVHILSTHTSKGLEYDVVLVAGLHKNGRSEGLKSKIGKIPRSFKWKASFDQKKFLNSPAYIVENLILKGKDFSESKRLLYVACTRAIKQLHIIEISHQGKIVSKYSNSWIQAFKNFADDIEFKNILLEKNPEKENEISLVLKDKVGIESYNANFEVGISSELSVTRLVSLIECPFKFYLKNICKINSDEFSTPVFDLEDTDQFVSSAKRGSDLHFQISEYLKGNRVEKISEEANWALGEFKSLGIDEFFSESEIKFPFFGNMISAIPDLYFKNGDSYEVWDFKSGKRDEVKEISYWFQLFAYAYGISMIDKNAQESHFNLRIIYLDQKNKVSKSLNLIEIKEYLFNQWQKLENLSQVNLSHCGKCEFNQMCKSASTVATI